MPLPAGHFPNAGILAAIIRAQPHQCQGCGHNRFPPPISRLYALELDRSSCQTAASAAPVNPPLISTVLCLQWLARAQPSLAEGALFADLSLKGIGISGDGDTANIGLSQFKHVARRNLPMVYIVENNGVYGLTKGQFSATAEKGLKLKRQGENPYLPVDIALEAIAANASFVARSFAGDPKQVKELIKAALSHDGTAILDIISPCVTFNNQDYSLHSYSWGKGHEAPLHEVEFVLPREEITVEDFERGTIKELDHARWLTARLKKLSRDMPHQPHRGHPLLEEAIRRNWLITGAYYVAPNAPRFFGYGMSLGLRPSTASRRKPAAGPRQRPGYG